MEMVCWSLTNVKFVSFNGTSGADRRSSLETLNSGNKQTIKIIKNNITAVHFNKRHML